MLTNNIIFWLSVALILFGVGYKYITYLELKEMKKWSKKFIGWLKGDK